jgi:hypothetical protein
VTAIRFDYPAHPDPIREDLAEAHRRTWRHVAAPGTWLSGEERVAVAAATRRAHRCTLCAERRSALSPLAVEGRHDDASALPPALVDVVHRVTTDARRLTRGWFDGILAQGVPVEHYVEALGVAVRVISVDGFHHAMGLPEEPLPEPEAGEPTRVRPAGLVEGEAWVPMVDPRRTDPATRGILSAPGGRAPAVLRALSLVPDEVGAWLDLSASQYLSPHAMASMQTGRALDRSQVELVAGRVSALNECFY